MIFYIPGQLVVLRAINGYHNHYCSLCKKDVLCPQTKICTRPKKSDCQSHFYVGMGTRQQNKKMLLEKGKNGHLS